MLPKLQKEQNKEKTAIEFWHRFAQKKLFCYSRSIREESSDGNSPTTIRVDSYLESLTNHLLKVWDFSPDLRGTELQLCKEKKLSSPVWQKLPRYQENIQQHSNRKWIFINNEYSLHFNSLCWPPCHKYNGITGEKNDFRIGEMFERYCTMAVK